MGAQIELSRRQDSPLLGRGYKLPRFGEAIIPPELDLNKSQNSPFPCDDIDFSHSTAEISFQDTITVPTEIPRGPFLAKGAETANIHQCIFLKKLGR